MIIGSFLSKDLRMINLRMLLDTWKASRRTPCRFWPQKGLRSKFGLPRVFVKKTWLGWQSGWQSNIYILLDRYHPILSRRVTIHTHTLENMYKGLPSGKPSWKWRSMGIHGLLIDGILVLYLFKVLLWIFTSRFIYHMVLIWWYSTKAMQIYLSNGGPADKSSYRCTCSNSQGWIRLDTNCIQLPIYAHGDDCTFSSRGGCVWPPLGRTEAAYTWKVFTWTCRCDLVDMGYNDLCTYSWHICL